VLLLEPASVWVVVDVVRDVGVEAVARMQAAGLYFDRSRKLT